MAYPRKGKVRWGALTAVLSTIGGIALTVLNDPHVIQSAAGKLGISTAILGSIIAAVTKTVVRKPEER